MNFSMFDDCKEENRLLVKSKKQEKQTKSKELEASAKLRCQLII